MPMKQVKRANHYAAVVATVGGAAFITALLAAALSDEVTAPQALSISISRDEQDPTKCLTVLTFGVDWTDATSAAALGLPTIPGGRRELRGNCSAIASFLSHPSQCKVGEDLPPGWPAVSLGNAPPCP